MNKSFYGSSSAYSSSYRRERPNFCLNINDGGNWIAGSSRHVSLFLSFFLWEQTSTLFPRPYWNWNPWNREMRHQRLIKVDRSTKVKNQSSNLLVAGWCCSVVSAALLFVFIIRNRGKRRFGDSSRRLSARIPHYWLGDRHPSGILLKERRRM